MKLEKLVVASSTYCSETSHSLIPDDGSERVGVVYAMYLCKSLTLYLTPPSGFFILNTHIFLNNSL